MTALTSLLETLDLSLYGTDTDLLYQKVRSFCNVVSINSEKLPNIYKKCLQHRQHYILFIRSPMGSGKTFQLKHIIKCFKRSLHYSRHQLKALTISPRRSFTDYAGKQLPSFSDYRNAKAPYSYIKYPRFIVQLQSLVKFDDIANDTHSVKGYQLLILDELQSLIAEMFSRLSTPQQQHEHVSAFVKIVRTVPRVICLDAHLSLDLINIIKTINSHGGGIDKSFICLINQYKRSDFKLIFYRTCFYNNLVIRLLKNKLCKSTVFGKYKSLLNTQSIQQIVVSSKQFKLEKIFMKLYIKNYLQVSSDSSDILVEMFRSLQRGEKLCVTTSTKRQANILKTLFKSVDFKVLTITGDSSSDKKKTFAQHPDKFVEHCQLFIFTTAFQVGIDVSANVPYFDTHYIFMQCSTNVASPAAFCQTIGRIRKIKSKQYKIIILDMTKRNTVNRNPLGMNDLIPLDPELLMPSSDKINANVKQLLTSYHFKEKSLGEDSHLYINMFIRLMSCKCKPFVMINDRLIPVEDVTNFQTFQCSYKDYDSFVDNFIEYNSAELQRSFDKHVKKIWKDLEVSSMYVSTVVNNFDAFIRLPERMSRSECLLKICEYTCFKFGFLYVYIFADDSDVKKRYFEKNLKGYFHNCDIADLQTLKLLVLTFVQKCIYTLEKSKWQMNTVELNSLLDAKSKMIVSCYSKFVNNIIRKSAKVKDLLVDLLSKALRIYVFGNNVDMSEMKLFTEIIDANKLIRYEMHA